MDLAQWLASLFSLLSQQHDSDSQPSFLHAAAKNAFRCIGFLFLSFFFSLSFLAGSVDECAVNERRMKRPLCSPRCSQPCLICALAVERLQAHSGSKQTARLMTLVFANWPWVLLIFHARLSPDPYTTPVQVRLRHQRRKRNRFTLCLCKSPVAKRFLILKRKKVEFNFGGKSLVCFHSG